MDSPFNIMLYNKSFVRQGWLNDPASLRLVSRHNAVSALELIIPLNHPKAALLGDKAGRCVVEYHGVQEFSGKFRSVIASHESSSLTATFEGDLRELFNMLGWPAPTQPITNQGAVSAYDKRTGAAETVAKGFVAANASRLSKPITVATDGVRGATITVQMRMHNMVERLLPVVEQAGLGMKMYQSGSGLVFDVYETNTLATPLSIESGIVKSFELALEAPKVTRAVIAGQGEGTARGFRTRINSSRETEYGDKIEGFVDARDTAVTAEMDARGDEMLLEGAPTAGLRVELSETKNFRYGDRFRVGDTITINIGGGFTVTDILREAELNWTRENGLTVNPSIGERANDPMTTFVRRVSQAIKAVRDLQRT
jgi:hypothetical protein